MGEIANRIISRGYKYPKPIVWIRASIDDLEIVLKSDIKEVNMLCSISDYHIYYKFNLDRERTARNYLSVISKTLSKELTVKIALEDVTRADIINVTTLLSSIAMKIITRKATERIVRYAFNYAIRNSRRRVTVIHKANILKQTDGLFREVFFKEAGKYNVKADEMIIDSAAYQLVKKTLKYSM